jgi:hypothetical protein
MSNIVFSSDTPPWIKDWVNWAVDCLIPSWDVNITMVEKLDPECPDDKGEAYAYSDYLRLVVHYDTSLQDTTDGHERVVHEIIHGFLANMGDAAENLVTSKSIKKSSWPRYVNAEETTVVILSRLLVSLRGKELSTAEKE